MTYQRDIIISILLCIASILVWAWSAPSRAQEPTPIEGTVGCVLTWNYPADQEVHVGAFPIWVDGQWRKAAGPSVRSVPCDDVGMSSAGSYTLELFTRAKPDSGFSNSPRVAFTVTLTAKKKPADAPTEIRLTMP